MNARKTYSGAFKAKVIIELIKGKKSLSELAKEYGVHENLIKNWKSRLLKEAPKILEDKRHLK